MAVEDNESDAHTSPTFVAATELRRRVGYREAAEAISTALTNGLDPAEDLPRSSESLTYGSLLLMPSDDGQFAGIKVLTMAPENPHQGLDLIQGMYLLFDATTLTPTHIIDGPALTDLRTAAMSVAAILPAMQRFQRPIRAVIFGAGHQGTAHAEALRELMGQRPGVESVTAVVRRPESMGEHRAFDGVVALGSEQMRSCLQEADVVMCATPATQPLFDSALLRPEVVVTAVGSHTPEARELDAALMSRGDVIVEDRATALRECGDVIQAIRDGALTESDLIPVREVLTSGCQIDHNKPYVFKGSGMPWQDLAVARAYVEAVDAGAGQADR